MDVGKLFQGIAVIIDDEVNQEGSSIVKIKKVIEARNIPVISFSNLPRQEMIPSLAKASFIILDWDYFGSAEMGGEDERVTIPSALREDQEKELLLFVEKLINQSFMPIFIFTLKPLDEVTAKLEENNLWNPSKPKRIFVQEKSKVSSDSQLFGEIENWLKKVPSVYVLKEWEAVVSLTKIAMFRELFDFSPNWTKIVWDMLKEDGSDYCREFGQFITKQLANRVENYAFDESIIAAGGNINADELASIVEGERFVSYNDQNRPSQSITGDLYLEGATYYLNIRAQCDLARNSNPEVYLIKGKELKNEDIETGSIRLTSEQRMHFGQRKSYTLDELLEIAGNTQQLGELNAFLERQRHEAFFMSGNILGKKSDVYIACVAGKKALKFRLDIAKIEKYNARKSKLIGRILSPYITCIQQSCANYITREGTIPTPRQVFTLD